MLKIDGVIDGIIIAGPTASGKSAYALDLAEKYDGLIINADSRQVYRNLKVLTAHPEFNVRNRIYDYIDSHAAYSVMHWISDVKPIFTEGKCPIFVGGTGFYIQALLNGEPEMFEYDASAYEGFTVEECHHMLKEIDIVYAEKVKDKRRMIKAIEYNKKTGLLLSERKFIKTIDKQYHQIYIDRLDLKERILLRIQQTIDFMIEEVKSEYHMVQGTILATSIGVKEIMLFLNQQCTKEELITKLYHKTWQYAKRQRTWFKKYYRPDEIFIL